jgi:hypothetical protein
MHQQRTPTGILCTLDGQSVDIPERIVRAMLFDQSARDESRRLLDAWPARTPAKVGTLYLSNGEARE